MTQERLYTPWRLKYILSNDKKKDGCVFCTIVRDTAHDVENYVLYRSNHAFAVLNLYPYNVGHVMLLPYQHASTLSQLAVEMQNELMALTSYFTDLLTEILKPDGFNIGLNIGKAAGAGVDTHLHLHIVPRWNGDSNFLPVLGQTRLLPEELADTYARIVARLKEGPPFY